MAVPKGCFNNVLKQLSFDETFLEEDSFVEEGGIFETFLKKGPKKEKWENKRDSFTVKKEEEDGEKERGRVSTVGYRLDHIIWLLGNTS